MEELVEKMDVENVMPYLPQIMAALERLAASGDIHDCINSISCIGAIAEQVKELFMPYYEAVSNQLIKMMSIRDITQLSLLCQAIGKYSLEWKWCWTSVRPVYIPIFFFLHSRRPHNKTRWESLSQTRIAWWLRSWPMNACLPQ